MSQLLSHNSVDACRPASPSFRVYSLQECHPSRYQARELFEKHGNQVYVTDLGLATEHRAAQAKANTCRTLNPKLVGTARFASVNGHLGVGECSVLINKLECLPSQPEVSVVNVPG